MAAGKAGSDPIRGEARLRIEGGLAHFPGRAREQVVAFEQLAEADRQEIARLAGEADFFNCKPAPASARPDARTYTLGLTIDGRSGEVRLAEPIDDPALATLVAKVRRLIKHRCRTAVACGRAPSGCC